MNILVVSALQISPPVSGGNLRTFQICKALADAGHQVRIESLIGRKSDYLRLAGTNELKLSEGLTERVNRGLVRGFAGIASYKVGLPPFWATGRLEIESRFGVLAKSIREADAVIADFPFTYPVLKRCGKTKLRVLNTHNVEHKLFGPKWQEKVQKLEIAASSTADLVVCCSDADAGFFRELPGSTQTLVVPNGIDLNRFRFDQDERARARQSLALGSATQIFLFAASAYGPNAEGLGFLKNFVSKHHRQMEANRQVFLVVGSVASQPASEPGLIVAGRVPAIEPYYAAADCMINPIFSGSGTSVKLAEAIAAKLPVLTTPVGARGFEFRDQVHGVEFNDEHQLLNALAAAKDKPLMSKMADRALTDNLNMIDIRAGIRPLLKFFENCRKDEAP